MTSNNAFPIVRTPFGRRQFLWSAAAGVVVLGAGSTLAGCAKNKETAAPSLGEPKPESVGRPDWCGL